MRIAFFGGSFDPPHAGHLAIARAALEAIPLDTVLFAPVALQPLKPGGSSAGFEDRAAMTRLAIAGQPGCELSLIDAPGASASTPNYTADTLERLRASLAASPGLLPATAELYLLLGFDSFSTLAKWHRAEEIPFLASLIVASRPGAASHPGAASGPETAVNPILQSLAACLPSGITLSAIAGHANQFRLTGPEGRKAVLYHLPDLHYDISATELRQAIHAHADDASQAIPAPVLAYISEHNLYR